MFLVNNRWAIIYLILYALRLGIYFLETSQSEQEELLELKSRATLICFIIAVIRLAGIPPIARFWVKVLILKAVINNLITIRVLILGSIFYLYFYFSFSWAFLCTKINNFFFQLILLKKSSTVITITLLASLVIIRWIWNISVKHKKIWPF